MMGCTASSGADDNRGARVFDVANIDDSGHERSTGRLEVTSTDLVLYCPGPRRDTALLRWPFQTLRRYGFNDHLFSFESGRRCPSGHGIYAFRCSRAEQLFRRLQEAIARAGEERARSLGQQEEEEEEEEQGSRSLAAEIRRTEDQTRNSGNALRTAERTILNGIDSPFVDYINEANLTESWRRRYVNNHQTMTSDPLEEEVSATMTPQPRQSPTPSSCLLLLHRPPSPSTTRDEAVLQYAQLELPMELMDYDEEADVFQTPEAGSVPGYFRPTYVNLPSSAVMTAPTQGPVAGGDEVSSAVLTYAQLDLDASAEGGGGAGGEAAAAVPRRGVKGEFPPARDRPEVYAHIDFRRTIALSTRTTSETDDEGFRKTRHNSSIEIVTRN